jgi:hypothetical protein
MRRGPLKQQGANLLRRSSSAIFPQAAIERLPPVLFPANFSCALAASLRITCPMLNPPDQFKCHTNVDAQNIPSLKQNSSSVDAQIRDSPPSPVSPPQGTLSRRAFLERSALAAGVAALAPFNILHAANKGNLVRCALIGGGARGTVHLDAMRREKIVALVDADESRHPVLLNSLRDKDATTTGIQVFTDYRRMFDKIGKQLDAVFVAAPNHHHALPAMLAMQSHIGAYVDKPLCHDIAEARALRELAAKSRAATQMGAQGHNEDGYRKLCELIWSGAIGAVRETHSWTNRANGGTGRRPPPLPVPKGVNWDAWIGPAPFRHFHEELHPHEWHGWRDFGNGSIGNMGCHVLDGVFWALKIGHPERIELEQIRGGGDERFPTGARVRWNIPQRGELPPAKIFWYEGLNPNAAGTASGRNRTATGSNRNLPPLLTELMQQNPDDELDRGGSGTLYVGDRGILFSGTYGDNVQFIPRVADGVAKPPPRVLPRPRDIFTDFLDAVRAGKKETGMDFDYASRLTEFTLLANLAMFAGVGNPVAWDGPNMKVTNHTALNRWVKQRPRRGWRA